MAGIAERMAMGGGPTPKEATSRIRSIPGRVRKLGGNLNPTKDPRRNPLLNPFAIFGKGGIKYHKITNPYNGVTVDHIRANVNKQRPEAGFNRPDFAGVAADIDASKAKGDHPITRGAKLLGSLKSRIWAPAKYSGGKGMVKTTPEMRAAVKARMAARRVGAELKPRA